ncbi:hypothetical protein [Cellulomonas bogoriensis]|uniref:Uncharacterized protein n=1 Tax=Cellulomonas bogoriensis 69B4 = DSM 16987 TaxID=1386082 RepID=A0A0A0BZV9_9CELL|nr:hypothetical protein [Cellulomonas bogoriensis]KGM13938.1 hypothetical protein N869_07710 [Cellulomonas bogoriensis 69B4 = DSM 16987]
MGRRAARPDREQSPSPTDVAVLAGTCALVTVVVLRWVGSGWVTALLLGGGAAVVVLAGSWMTYRGTGR